MKVNYLNENNQNILVFTSNLNEVGIIHKITAILLAHNLNIIEASAETSEENHIKDIFVVKGNKLSDETIKSIENDTKKLFSKKIEVLDYLCLFDNLKMIKRPDNLKKVNVFNAYSDDATVLDIVVHDRVGLLFEISQLLCLINYNIVGFTAETINTHEARDTFLILNSDGKSLNENQREILKGALLAIL